MKIIVNLIIVLAISLLFAHSGFTSSFECNNKIISLNDTKAIVAMKCGAPSWKETHEVEWAYETSPGEKIKQYITVEKWFYNFGPDHFVHILTFRDSNLSDIKTGGYGYSEEKTSNVQCGERVLAIKDLQPEVIAKCGEPTYKDKTKKQIIKKGPNGEKIKITINIEKWTYNFGPDYLILILEFRNGKLVSIKNGGFGY